MLDELDCYSCSAQVVHALLEAAVEDDSCGQLGIGHLRWRQLMPSADGQVRGCLVVSALHSERPVHVSSSQLSTRLQRASRKMTKHPSPAQFA